MLMSLISNGYWGAAASSPLSDDFGNDHPGSDPGLDLRRPWLRCYGPDGDPVLWWNDDRAHKHIRCAGALLYDPGVQAETALTAQRRGIGKQQRTMRVLLIACIRKTPSIQSDRCVRLCLDAQYLDYMEESLRVPLVNRRFYNHETGIFHLSLQHTRGNNESTIVQVL